MKLIPVIKVSRETIESILKSRVGLVQRQTWVKDGSGRKGHYRMQWVSPGEGKDASDYNKQLDLFGKPESKKPGGDVPTFQAGKKYRHKKGWEGRYVDTSDEKINGETGWQKWENDDGAKWTGKFKREDFEEIPNEAYKPMWPDKGEFVGNGLGDNGREYEGYRAKDGSTHFYDTETGREIGEDGEYLDEKKTDPKAEGKPLIDQIKVTKVSRRQIEFEYQGETYAMGARSDNPVGLKTIQEDGKAWYSYGGKLSKVRYKEKTELEDALRKKYGKFDPEKQMYEFSDLEKGEKAKDKAGEYKIYHDTFTGVIDEVVNHLGKQGLYMAEDDVFHKIATGPGRPKGGRTDRYNIPLFTGEGKAAGKAVAFQVYDMDGKKFELNMYVSPMKKTLYQDDYEDTVQVRKPAGEEKPADERKDFKEAQEYAVKNGYLGADEVNHSQVADLLDKINKSGALSEDKKKKLVELQAKATIGAEYSTDKEKSRAKAELDSLRGGKVNESSLLTALADALFVLGGYNKNVVSAESKEGADIVASAVVKMASGGANKKKPFEDMTFEAQKTTGKPSNIAETVRAVMDMSSGSAAQFADSRKVDDIDKFQQDAAKWAYENDKVGTAFDILDQYARHKGLRKSIVESFREGLAKAFGRG